MTKRKIKTQVCGGAVRDVVIYLLANNLPLKIEGKIEDYMERANFHDIDRVIVGETEETMASMGYEPVGKDFPVYIIDGEEHALLRTEESTGDGHGDYSFCTNGITRKQDSARRDFRFNGFFLNEDGTIQDFFGGIEDLKNKIIHHTSEQFKTDPLRALRAGRFLARFTDFTIHKDTIKLCRSLKPKMKALTQDRIFKELVKALNEEKPSLYFRALKKMDLLEVTYPHIHAMIGCEQRVDFHAEGDVFEHTMRVLDEVCKISKNPMVRYAALFHDIGKPVIFEKTGKYHGHEDEDILKPLFNELRRKGDLGKNVQSDFNLDHAKKYVDLAEKVAICHHIVHNFKKMNEKTMVKKILKGNFPKKGFEFQALLDVCLADERGRVSGFRKLTKEENDILFNGGNIEGFTVAERKVDYSFLVEVFNEVHKKPIIPKDVLSRKGTAIGQWVYNDKVKRVRALKNKLVK